ncbi:DUF4209 domain-containing protein [Candidatus Poriferisodalis sp.]|uniref:DUF4209 domain-containing protein n=1 Tax=Candidatus Poriferisodalis sp. TaxID=3101277 RepID=UPI003C6F6DD3
MTSKTVDRAPYVETVARVCAQVDAEQGRRFVIYPVHDRLQALSKDRPDDDVLRALADACGYHMRRSARDVPFACGPFEPLFVFGNQDDTANVYPMPLDSVEHDVLDVWSACTSHDAMHPLVRSRLCDLLWVRRHSGPKLWFREAVLAYLDLADTPVDVLERSAGLTRAVDICKETRQQDLLDRVLASLARVVRESLSRTTDEFGIVARGLDALAESGFECAEIMSAASEVYCDDPWQVSRLREIALKIAPNEQERQRLQAERVEAFEAAAEAADGLLRFSHLSTALEIAESAGLTSDSQRLRNKLENTDAMEDAHHVEVSGEIDMTEMRAEVDSILGDGDLREALLRYGALLPISDPEETREEVAAQRNAYPLQSLVTQIRIGPHNSAVVLPSGHEMRDAAEIGERDAMRIGVFAAVTGKLATDEIQRRYEPGSAELTECIQNTIITPQIAQRIARSHERWLDGDCTSAVSVLIPTLEQAVRNICSHVGINVTKAPQTTTPTSEARTLQPLLAELEDFLGTTRHRYLQAALTDRWSLNLRNNFAHGLDAEATPEQYIVLFHIACVLFFAAECALAANDGN